MCGFGACGETVHHGGGMWLRKMLTVGQLGSEREKQGGAGILQFPSRAFSQQPNLPQDGLPPNSFPTFQ